MRLIKSILLAGDDPFESQVFIRHLGSDYELHLAIKDEPRAHQLFREHMPELLVLSFESVGESERAYLDLVRKAPDSRGVPHQAFLFCQHKEQAAAAHLCVQGTVDDYVVCRPYFDVSRLAVALHMAEQRMRAHMESGSLERRLEEAAGGFDSLRQLQPESLRRMDEARDTGEAGYLRILSEVNHEFHDLSRSLSSKLRDAAAAEHLTEELHRFNQQQVKPRFAQQRNELAMPYEALVGEICGKVDSLAETAERIAPPRRRTVLVVDDDPVMRSLLCELLEDEKYLVYEAGDAAAAMLMLGRVHPDAILLDYMMPNKNGIALLQEMHAIADLKDVPVIMLTAHSDRHVVQASLEAGARDFLVKPIDPSNLSRKLKKCFS